ncbi:MAG: hypothetical protein QW514_09970 [Thermoprotei archaeon]
MDNGPEILYVHNIPQQSTNNVPVWVNGEHVNLLYEFPNTPNATIGVEMSTSLMFSANAQVNGGIQTGFLGVNYAGYIGTTLTLGSGWSFSASKPYVLYYEAGMAYKVEDINGNSVIYVQSFTTSNPQSNYTSDYLTMSQAISRDEAQGIYPYEQIIPTGTFTFYKTFNGTITLDSQVSVTAFDVTLSTEVSVAQGSQLTISYSITNNSPYYQCHVIYSEGPEVHVWYYGQGQCP